MRDEAFIRGKVPMSKSEVRAISLSKLELEPGAVLYDIGAGTGSVSVEAALTVDGIRVYAIEQKPEAVELIRANIEKFKVDQVKVISGAAPQALEGLERPTHVFLGGSGGRMEEILDLVLERNPQVRIVINVIALESLVQVVEYLQKRQMEAETVCVQIARAEAAGPYHLMRGQNPVYVISCGGKEGSL